jgi:hypothetical protein
MYNANFPKNSIKMYPIYNFDADPVFLCKSSSSKVIPATLARALHSTRVSLRGSVVSLRGSVVSFHDSVVSLHSSVVNVILN